LAVGAEHDTVRPVLAAAVEFLEQMHLVVLIVAVGVRGVDKARSLGRARR